MFNPDNPDNLQNLGKQLPEELLEETEGGFEVSKETVETEEEKEKPETFEEDMKEIERLKEVQSQKEVLEIKPEDRGLLERTKKYVKSGLLASTVWISMVLAGCGGGEKPTTSQPESPSGRAAETVPQLSKRDQAIKAKEKRINDIKEKISEQEIIFYGETSFWEDPFRREKASNFRREKASKKIKELQEELQKIQGGPELAIKKEKEKEESEKKAEAQQQALEAQQQAKEKREEAESKEVDKLMEMVTNDEINYILQYFIGNKLEGIEKSERVGNVFRFDLGKYGAYEVKIDDLKKVKGGAIEYTHGMKNVDDSKKFTKEEMKRLHFEHNVQLIIDNGDPVPGRGNTIIGKMHSWEQNIIKKNLEDYKNEADQLKAEREEIKKALGKDYKDYKGYKEIIIRLAEIGKNEKELRLKKVFNEVLKTSEEDYIRNLPNIIDGLTVRRDSDSWIINVDSRDYRVDKDKLPKMVPSLIGTYEERKTEDMLQTRIFARDEKLVEKNHHIIIKQMQEQMKGIIKIHTTPK